MLFGNDDIFFQIVQHMDIVSFIYLMMSCKQFYNMRKCYFKHIIDMYQYRQFDKTSNLIVSLLNSYIDIDLFRTDNYISKIPLTDINESKIKNTVNILSYTMIYKNNTNLYNYTIKYAISEMICKKYNYIYSKNFNNFTFKLHCYFDNIWFKSLINIFDIYEIAYHLKNRKYKKILELFMKLEFKSKDEYIFHTLHHMLEFISNQNSKKFKICLICVLYTFIEINADKITAILLRKEIVNKANELLYDLNKIKELPKYIKYYISNKLINVCKILV